MLMTAFRPPSVWSLWTRLDTALFAVYFIDALGDTLVGSSLLLIFLTENLRLSDEHAVYLLGLYRLFYTVYRFAAGFYVDQVPARSSLLATVLCKPVGAAVLVVFALAHVGETTWLVLLALALYLTVYAASEAFGGSAHSLSVLRLSSGRYRSFGDMVRRAMVRLTYQVSNVASGVSFGLVTLYRTTVADVHDANVAMLATAAALYVLAAGAAAGMQFLLVERGDQPRVLAAYQDDEEASDSDKETDTNGRAVPLLATPAVAPAVAPAGAPAVAPAAPRRARPSPGFAARVAVSWRTFWASTWGQLALFHVSLTGVDMANFHLWLTLPKYMMRHDALDTTFALFLAINPVLVVVLSAAFGLLVDARLADKTRSGEVMRLLLLGSLLQATAFVWLLVSPSRWALAATIVHYTVGETIGMPSAELVPLRLGGEQRSGLFLSLPVVYGTLLYVANAAVSARLLDSYCPSAVACASTLWYWVMGAAAWSPLFLTLVVVRHWINV